MDCIIGEGKVEGSKTEDETRFAVGTLGGEVMVDIAIGFWCTNVAAVDIVYYIYCMCIIKINKKKKERKKQTKKNVGKMKKRE